MLREPSAHEGIVCERFVMGHPEACDADLAPAWADDDFYASPFGRVFYERNARTSRAQKKREGRDRARARRTHRTEGANTKRKRARSRIREREARAVLESPAERGKAQAWRGERRVSCVFVFSALSCPASGLLFSLSLSLSLSLQAARRRRAPDGARICPESRGFLSRARAGDNTLILE